MGRYKRCGLISHVGKQCSLQAKEVSLVDPGRIKLSSFNSTDLVPSAYFVFTSQPPCPLGSSMF